MTASAYNHLSVPTPLSSVPDSSSPLGFSQNSANGAGQNIMYDPNASFMASFGDAYTFRNTIEYLNTTNREGTFVFSRDQIRYIQGVEIIDNQVKNPILNDITIDTSHLIDYQYDSIYPELPIRINIETIRSITRDIQKKNILCMYKVPHDDTLYLRIDGSESASDSQTNISHLQPIRISEMLKFSVEDYSRPESRPNCTIMTSSFSRACTSLPHIGCEEVEIRGYLNGITITAKIPNSTAGKAFRFGTVTDDELSEAVHTNFDSVIWENPSSQNDKGSQPKLRLNIISDTPVNNANTSNETIPTVRIPVRVMRLLTKINNLASNGVTLIYVEPNRPLKLMAFIGNYGVIRIYIRE